jgi:hypothetical protein
MATVRAYVDGFNLYYRALKGTRYKWLDLVQLARGLIDPADTLDWVRYFTARISPRAGDPDAPRRQQLYLSALSGFPEISVHYGRFLPKTKKRPLVGNPSVFVEVHDTEEKGSDVNLAAYLLHDGWQAKYDVALVLSQDTDLCEPLRMVSQELRRPVGLVVLDGAQPNGRLRALSSFVRHLTPARLAAAQFPDPTADRAGRPVRKPATW